MTSNTVPQNAQPQGTEAEGASWFDNLKLGSFSEAFSYVRENPMKVGAILGGGYGFMSKISDGDFFGAIRGFISWAIVGALAAWATNKAASYFTGDKEASTAQAHTDAPAVQVQLEGKAKGVEKTKEPEKEKDAVAKAQQSADGVAPIAGAKIEADQDVAVNTSPPHVTAQTQQTTKEKVVG